MARNMARMALENKNNTSVTKNTTHPIMTNATDQISPALCAGRSTEGAVKLGTLVNVVSTVSIAVVAVVVVVFIAFARLKYSARPKMLSIMPNCTLAEHQM